MVDGSGLENRQGASPRGFESHPLRQNRSPAGYKGRGLRPMNFLREIALRAVGVVGRGREIGGSTPPHLNRRRRQDHGHDPDVIA